MFHHKFNIERWTLAVGQGLFHYEEIWFNDVSRPLTIVYDAGTFNKSGRDSVAGTSVNFVINRLKKYGRSCLDYLVLSHYHLDHFSLINKLIDHIHINYFIAPLLTPEENYFEIINTLINWGESDYELLQDSDAVNLAQGLINEGTQGFIHSLLNGHNNKHNSGNPPINDEPVEQLDYHNEPTCLFITASGREINGEYENVLLQTFPRNKKSSKASHQIPDNEPIVIRSEQNKQRLWILAFYYYKPKSNNFRLNTKYLDQLRSDIRSISENKNGNSAISFKDIIDHFLYSTLQIPQDSQKKKKQRIKEIFGDSDMNMSSLCMYSGPYQPTSSFVVKGLNSRDLYSRSHFFYKVSTFPYEISNLVSTNRGPSFKMLDGKHTESLDISFRETEESKKTREKILHATYNWKPIEIRKSSDRRSIYWAWLGLGDINFSTETVTTDFINHFGKLLELVGCCNAPHHGSYNGFQDSTVPKKLSSSICVISCDPNYKYHHPHSEAIASMLEGGMIPILIDERRKATFHESIIWFDCD